MLGWVKRHPKTTALILTACVPVAFGSVAWIDKVSGVAADYPATEEDVEEILISNARFETDIDNCQERIATLEANQAELLQAIPRIDANLEWIRRVLEDR